MRVKVLSLALLALVVALPVPASLALTGSFSAPLLYPRSFVETADLRLLLQDPFLVDQMSHEHPKSVLDVQGAEDL
jgi:hypothetical protein